MIVPHAGIEDTTAAGLLTAWSWDPLAIGGLGLLAVLYGRGLARSRGQRRQVVAGWRPVAFYLGIVILLLAIVSPLDALAAHLFFMHMTQHMLLTMVGAPLVLLGAPMLPVLRGTPQAVRSHVYAPLAHLRWLRHVGGFLTLPLIAWPLHVATFWVWHLPVLYNAALESESVHILQHASFLGTAVLFWWNVIDPVPLTARLSYLGRFAYLILALIQSTPLAAILTFASAAWYRAYAHGPRLWGIDPLVDQQAGGLIMWVAGWALYFIAFSAVFFVAVNVEERQAQGGAPPPSPSEAGA